VASIGTYPISGVLYKGEQTTVYRGRTQDGRAVVLKLLTADAPTPGDLARYRYSYELTRGLAVEGAVFPIALDWHDRRPLLVMEDSGARSLAQRLEGGALALADVLALGVRVAGTLARLHTRGIIHCDVNPSNLICADDPGDAALIDFDLASRVTREQPEIREPELIRGTLAYIAPEQTGRLHRSVDQRADLYSLGVTLYELLTGQKPFRDQDPTALIYSHIARNPRPPHAVAPAIPEVVSAVVMKLMAKTPEDRYQSAFGAQADLRRCLESLTGLGAVEPFPVAQQDRPYQLAISGRLFGRADEAAALLTAARHSATGAVALALISGEPGIGKSALVAQVQLHILETRGRYIHGKYNQLGGSPYAGLVEALAPLVRTLVALPEAAAGFWREAIGDALGSVGQAVVELLPELSLLVGEQAPLAPVPPNEAQNRFHRVFLRFVRALARADHPLVLFLDDLQWADPGSMALIEGLVTDGSGHLLLIGAYRSNEVDATHALPRVIEAAKASAVQVSEIALGPLDSDAVDALVADSLRATPQEVAPLASRILSATGGNPFFVEALLKALYIEGALSLDPERGTWGWDLQRVDALGVSDNVADLMSLELSRLPQDSQRALQLAASLGAEFELAALAAAADLSADEAARALWPAVEAELISPAGSRSRYAVMASLPEGIELRYRFRHDRIQTAAYKLCDADERGARHLRIGRRLQDGGELFDVVRHLNLSRSLITAPRERTALLRLNMEAASRATASSAHTYAREVLAIALELAGPTIWEEDRGLAAALFRALADAATMIGEYDRALELSEQGALRAETLAEKVSFVLVKLEVYSRLSVFDSLFSSAMAALALFGIEEPETPEGWGALAGREAAALAEAMAAYPDIRSLHDIPEMTDEVSILEMQVLAGIAPLASAELRLFPVIFTRMTRLSANRGYHWCSPLGYCTYALLQMMMQQTQQARDYVEMALDVSLARGGPVAALPIQHMGSCFVLHWLAPLPRAIEMCRVATTGALEAGIYTTGGWAAMNLPWLSMARGLSLEGLVAEAREYEALCHGALAFPNGERSFQLNLHALYRLTGQDEERAALDAAGKDEEALVEALGMYAMAACSGRMLLLQAAVFMGDLEEATRQLAQVDALLPASPGLVCNTELPFYGALVAVDRLRAGGPDAELRASLAGRRARLEELAALCEENTRYKLMLVDAELASLDGDDLNAAALFDRAVEVAGAAGFPHVEGLAMERAAAFYERSGRKRVARGYLADARHAYLLWGAVGLVRRLDRDNVFLQRGVSTTSWGGSTAMADFLDVQAVIRATRALTEELVLDRLLENVLRILVENAGAERGFLALDRGGELRLEAALDGGELSVLQSTPVAGDARLAEEIISYVARNRRLVLLDNAAQEGAFVSAAYVRRVQPRSVLCAPLLRQGQLVGVLYLENNLTRGAFTKQRVELLRVLSAQAATSLENATLYDDLQRQSAALQQKNEELTALNRAVGRFVPYDFLELLGRESIVDVSPGESVALEMTVLFSDVRAFTTFSESLSPEAVFGFINDFLGVMEPAILDNKGFIDKYIGDAIMALFAQGADSAMRAGVEMFSALADFNRRRQDRGEAPVRIGLGINSGSLMLGTVGGARRMDTTVLSDAVNLASRVEGLTKRYDVSFLITEHTRDALEDPEAWRMRWLDRVQVRGKQDQVDVFEVFHCDAPALMEAKAATQADFERAVGCFHGGKAAEAAALFAVCGERAPDDGAARRYLERCGRALAAGPKW